MSRTRWFQCKILPKLQSKVNTYTSQEISSFFYLPCRLHLCMSILLSSLLSKFSGTVICGLGFLALCLKTTYEWVYVKKAKHFLWGCSYPDTETTQKLNQERELQTNLTHEHRHKKISIKHWQNESKKLKIHLPWSSWIHPRHARMVQHMKIYQCKYK